MCGITGFYSKESEGLDQDELIEANNLLVHRGPDNEGYFYKGADGKQNLIIGSENKEKNNKVSVGLGFKRLSILDVDKGNQPYISPDGRYISIFNGEIYNYKELKNSLKSWEFNTTSDGEVIIPMYIKYGIDFASKLNGMFAICIFDTKENSLVLVRDQVGIKPIYIYDDENFFAFSSEIKSLLSFSKIKKDFDRNAIYNYLTFQNTFGAQTLFKNINLLEKGSVLEFKNNTISKTFYWSYDDNGLSNEYSRSALLDRLTQAVQRQLISDVPIGTYLSSGIDTSTVTSLANTANQKFSAITCGYDNDSIEPEYGIDEKKLARITSKSLGVEHFIYILNKPSLADTLYKTIFHLDEPRMGYSYQNLIISNATSNHFKVVLSGVGSDELFGGYPWRYKNINNNTLDKDGHYKLWNRVVGEDEHQSAFIQNEYLSSLYSPRDHYEEALSSSEQSSPLSTIFAFEFNTFLQGLLIVEDKLSMANSLESRVPFLDIDLIEYVTGIDPKLKYKGDVGKVLLKDAIRGMVPENVLSNPKVGFIPPIEFWREDRNKEFILKLLDKKNIEKFEIFKYEYIDRILGKFFSGDDSVARGLWSILCIQAWLDIYFTDDISHESFYNFDYKNSYIREM
ncbi:MAG: asparagine synthase (glutamine-hydrolyzing) [Actinobacteria bacterium]|nr:asparagine synthase (glutamine-hydrolyzing) [Actinomycetota bacterium]|tara:strand:- start:3387 stop:5261 length:1875 start_codon:yes stop_codon:yes gene_type:complete